ncbi:response regulator transcription factor [Endozoicomonas sp. SM1973]|uniref:Response regulator transcription factor n=1 Tax=Spartinivicinus marinus TaxID=2994442 RepID=A0A853IAF1_9GAMM|nr:response regulator transcription factor [Spartinivicinus marinus]MCX4027028.1 response regulator transcription factor [Spartinivicinus marinus]NYZ67024.1 response regulator transcription factor [Spartinivicinus marinus]
MKVLIAEDDTFIREGLNDLLSNEGYSCILAENGQQAWQYFQSEQPDLVLLDIMMPEKDGYSLCREIRQVNQDIPVIFITAKSEEIDQVLGLELGADDYIMKPFGTREVVARIRAVTRRYLRSQAKVQQEKSFTIADLVVYPDELRAQRGEQVIDLSLRDIKILCLLYSEKGKVVGRDALFNHCWGRGYIASSRTLDQHISKLRKAIEVDPKNPLVVKTVHGVGYRIE